MESSRARARQRLEHRDPIRGQHALLESETAEKRMNGGSSSGRDIVVEVGASRHGVSCGLPGLDVEPGLPNAM